MEEFLRYFLPIYWCIFFLLIIVWRSYVLWHKTGVNAFKHLSHEGVHGVVVFYNQWIPVISASSMITYVFFPRYYNYLAPFQWLQNDTVQLLGVICLVAALVLTWAAQAHMGDAWRLAPTDADTEHFVEKGLFTWSRNPIFVGVRLSLIGMFLVLSNGVILTLSVLAWMSLSVQVALEEEHLLARYGEPYKKYCARVRRWL